MLFSTKQKPYFCKSKQSVSWRHETLHYFTIMKSSLLFIILLLGMVFPSQYNNRCTAQTKNEHDKTFLRDSLPFSPAVSLYNKLIHERDKGNYRETIVLIDSLIGQYKQGISYTNLLWLAEMKADALMRLKRYETLLEFCQKTHETLNFSPITSAQMKRLEDYEQKAIRLTGNGLRNIVLREAEQMNIRELARILTASGDSLDLFARLYCESRLYRALHDTERWKECTDSLLLLFNDSLSSDDRHGLQREMAEFHLKEGNWETLAKDSIYAPHYKRIGKSLRGCSPTGITLQADSATWPITYEWPMLTLGHINQSPALDFHIGLSQEYTLISEKDAQDWNVRIFPDTLAIPTPYGMTKVSPAYAKQLAFPNVYITDAIVYMVHSDTALPTYLQRVLGLRELTRFGRITFYPEKMVVHPIRKINHQENALPRPRLFFTKHHAAATEISHDGSLHAVGLHTCFEYSMLPHDIREKKTFFGEHQLTSPSFQPLAANEEEEGFLGHDFFKTFTKITLDFDKMQMEAKGWSTYVPQRDCFDTKTNPFYLERNLTALLSCERLSTEEKNFLKVLVLKDKNQFKPLQDFCKILRHENSQFYDPVSEATALLLQGFHQKAGSLAEESLTKDSLDARQIHALTFIRHYRHVPDFIPPKITRQIIDRRHNGTFGIRHGNKEIRADFNPAIPLTIITRKAAKRLGVKELGGNDSIQEGLLPQVKIGDDLFLNLPCRIYSQKALSVSTCLEKGERDIIFGFHIIRHYKRFRSTPLNYDLNGTSVREDCSMPFRLNTAMFTTLVTPSEIERHPLFLYSSPKGDTYVTHSLSPETLLDKARCYTIDTERMLLQLE